MKSILCLSLLLCSCGFAPARVVEVRIPVPVPCEAPDVEKPVFEVDRLSLGAGIVEQMKALRIERKQRQGYEAELEAVVKGCRGK
ncbi:MAG: hypothetical protein IPO08_22940 [Xanthomonadales bacterium]|nr:hypothetical protein [Xanthomonadales bacterium]